ncbi:hypothetical protein AGABI1DRAFT_63949 [Lichtheimia corymbifera JMRC:FSU:9682]|uniref:Pq loop repeat protein n=1 Tax=Lichtheimia corymbifera JMRC:FSU:9682 TaxID=1263082 RepID=A0A068SBY4_9FUNG|nr:hypothetical protein AGABI1DRAFT_63949 [Lichtheimia corymbifera JMRC:FSU:9682]
MTLAGVTSTILTAPSPSPWTIQDDNGQQCQVKSDTLATLISVFLCIGLVVSYMPQHYRIIVNKTSEGFSSWFLLLGVVSSTSSFLNIILLQWDAIVCCGSLSTGACLASLMGVFQIMLQWTMFSLVFILFLIYFPEKYAAIATTDLPTKVHTMTAEWKTALVIAAICTGHFAISFLITVILLAAVGSPSQHWETNYWAGILGILSMILASFQYLPQIWKTWKRKSVGALSIPMMLLQTPGSALFVYSLAVRPGTNWTAWITYLVTGCLQGTLLVMCIVWHFRNKRLGIDDLHGTRIQDERTPLLREENQ